VVTNGWLAVAEQLRSNAPTLLTAVEALRGNPKQVPYGFLDKPIFASNLRYRLLYWLMWATANDLREGDLEGAGENVLAIARLGKTFQSRHSGYYQRFAQYGLDATWELLQSGPTNGNQLSALQQAWSDGAVVPDLAKMSEVYRARKVEEMQTQTWKMAGNNNASALELQVSSPTSVALWFMGGRYFDEYAVLLISQDRFDSMRALAQTRQWKSWKDPGWSKRLRWCLPWSPAMLFAFSEDWYFSEHMLRIVEFETHREMAVAAIALQRYRLRHGQWPEKLEELIPEFLSALPRDWMDGQPLRYRLNANDTFTLYSVGEDLRDDGGDPSRVNVGGFDKSPLPMWTARDAVWPALATDENVAALKRASASK
jgi:hypothetical protein